MNITQLFTEDRAVSPVIGVILMVAITVILAAVIGAFVLNLGDGLGETAPKATFDINTTTLDTGQNATITHTAGDNIETARLSVSGDIDPSGAQVSSLANAISGDTVGSGDSFQVNASADSGTISVNWEAEDGSRSSTLRSFEYQ